MRIQIILAALLTVSAVSAASAQEKLSLKFNDPSRPGLLKVNWVNGSVTVRTHTENDVTILASGGALREPAPPEAGGLRRIDGGVRGLSANSAPDNMITVSGPSSAMNGNLEIEVPVKTNLNLLTRNGEAVTVDGVEGDIEVSNRNGAVVVTNVSGSVVADSRNGKVQVSFREMAAGKPMSFTSMNGSVDVTLPPSSKANLKMDTRNGAIYTDFDIQNNLGLAANTTRDANGNVHFEVEKTVTGTINGGGTDIELRTRNGNVYLRKAK